MSAKDKKQENRTSHTLLKPHRHGGVDLEKGAKVMLTDRQVKALQSAGVVRG